MNGIAIYTGQRLRHIKVGPFAALSRWQWTQWAVGFEFMPAGVIVFLGPLSIAFCHLWHNKEAGRGALAPKGEA